MQVIDNALSEHDFKLIKDQFTANMNVPYYLSNLITEDKGDDYLDCWQFVHLCIDNTNPLALHTLTLDPASYTALTPLLSVLNPYAIRRLKVNITHRTSKVVETGLHTDEHELNIPDGLKVKSSIFYLNTNDGYTSFESGEKVMSVENRLVLFDAMEKHAGSTCTDARYRAVVNCVYI